MVRTLVFCTFWLRNVLPAMPCTFSTSQLPKVVRDRQFLTFWLGNVLRATTACTFSTSQLPKAVRRWGIDFDFKMCFAPPRRALFRHRNFQKWSGVFCTFWLGNFDISTSKSVRTWVFCTFWLGNVLRATTACNFPSLLWPAGSAPAALASLFSTLLGHKSLEKYSVSRLSCLFAHSESCHSVTRAKVLLFGKAAPIFPQKSHVQYHFRSRKHIGFLDSKKVVLHGKSFLQVSEAQKALLLLLRRQRIQHFFGRALPQPTGPCSPRCPSWALGILFDAEDKQSTLRGIWVAQNIAFLAAA